MRHVCASMLLVTLILVAGSREVARVEAKPTAPPPVAAAPAPAPSPSASPAPSVQTAPAPAQAAFDAMDTRVPVPLLPMMANHQKQNMRDHLLAVQEIVQALAKNDLRAVEASAKRIGHSPEMGIMCTHMGAGAPGFTDQALKFHHTADGIGAAAHKRDRNGVVAALGATLQACTACHATFKQSIVDEATWTRVTQQAPPMGHMPMGHE